METGKNSSPIDSFSKQLASKCHLALNIYSKYLRIGISDLTSKQHIYFNEFKINSWKNDFEPFFEYEFGNSKFNKVTACLIESTNLLVPSAIYSDDLKNSLFQFSKGPQKKISLKNEKIRGIDSVNIYNEKNDIQTALSKTVKNFKIKHCQSVLLELLGRETKASEEVRAYVHVEDEFFDLFIFNAAKLILVNRYSYKTAKDFIYFLINCFEVLEFNVATVPFFLMGSIEKGDELHTLLSKYCNEVLFMNDSGIYQYSEAFTESEHSNYLLFNQVLCA